MPDQRYSVSINFTITRDGEGFNKVKQELDRINKGTDDAAKKGGLRWTELKSKIDLAAGSLRTVAELSRQAFEFSRQGAEINQLTASFERMNQEVFRTPDLMDRMRHAARGTISTAQLMSGILTLTAGATDEYSQALALASPNLVEIAKASNTLNPLLGSTESLYGRLAIAVKRQSALRADDLGLTINMKNAVRELHPALQAVADDYSDLTEQQRFLNEVLFQGEQLISQVGDSVESQTDPWDRLKTSWAESTDILKRQSAEGLGPLISDLADVREAQNAVARAQEEGIITQAKARSMSLQLSEGYLTVAEAVAILEKVTSKTSRATKDMADVLKPLLHEAIGADVVLLQSLGRETVNVSKAFDITRRGIEFYITLNKESAAEAEAWANALLFQKRVLGDINQEIERVNAAQAELNAKLGDYFVNAMEGKRGTNLFNESLDELGQSFVTIGGRTSNQNEDLSRLQDAYNRTAREVRDYEIGLKGASLSEEERAARIGELHEEMGRLNSAMQPLLSITGQLAERNVEATINQEALNQALFDAANAAGAGPQELASLASAYGLYSEEVIQAKLNTALIQGEIDRLAVAYADGTLSLDQATSSLDRFVKGITGEALPATANINENIVNMKEEAMEAAENVGGLNKSLRETPSEIPVHFRITHDPIPAFPSGPVGGGQRAAEMQHGGPVFKNQLVRAGEGNLPELLKTRNGLFMIPGEDGRIFSNKDSRSMMGGITYVDRTQHVYHVPDAATGKMVVRMIQEEKVRQFNSWMGRAG